MNTRGSGHLVSYGVLVGAGVLWGCTFSLSKLAATTGAHPLGITQLQATLSGTLMLGVCGVRRTWPALDTDSLGMYLLLALVAVSIPSTLFYSAAPHLPAGIIAITVSTVPLMTYAATLLLRLERVSPRRALGLLLGIAAVALIAGPRTALPDPAAAPWMFLVLGSAACYTAQNLYLAQQMRRRPDRDSIATICAFQCTAALALWPVTEVLDARVAIATTWSTVQFTVLCMSVIGMIAYTLYFFAIRTMGSVFASQVGYLVTAAGVGWGMLIFSERHSPWVWLALAVMFAGLACVTPRPPRVADLARRA